MFYIFAEEDTFYHVNIIYVIAGWHFFSINSNKWKLIITYCFVIKIVSNM